MEMNEFKALEDRLKVATDKVSALAGQMADQQGDGAEIQALRDENTRLRSELEALRETRRADMQELDALLEQLRPLMGEVNA